MKAKDIAALHPDLAAFLLACKQARLRIDHPTQTLGSAPAYYIGDPYPRESAAAVIQWAPDHPRQHSFRVRAASTGNWTVCTTLARAAFLMDLPRGAS